MQRAIAAAPVFVWWTLVAVILWLLRGVARTAAKGEPFRPSNIARLRWLGAIFLLGFPLATFVERSFTEWFFSADVWTGGPLPPGGVAITAPLLSGRRPWWPSACSRSRRCSRTASGYARTSMPRSEPEPQADHRIAVHLDRVLEARG